MLYVGNFSYNDDTDDADNYCLMPCVVKADDADDALDRFASLFERLKRKGDLLEGAHEIYLDSLVEMEDVPEEAVLAQWQKIVPASDGLCSVSAALPETDVETATAYGFDDGEEDEGAGTTDEGEEDEDETETDESPFMTFDEQ